jgi:hypothetical protein
VGTGRDRGACRILYLIARMDISGRGFLVVMEARNGDVLGGLDL